MKKKFITSLFTSAFLAFNMSTVSLAMEIDENENTEAADTINTSFPKDEIIDSMDKNVSQENKLSEDEVIIKNIEHFCDINISYKKEVYENPILMTGATSMNLEYSFEVPENSTLDESLLSDDSDVNKILDSANLPNTLQTGYDIVASINLEGEVSIESLKETNVIEIETEVLTYEEVEEEIENDEIEYNEVIEKVDIENDKIDDSNNFMDDEIKNSNTSNSKDDEKSESHLDEESMTYENHSNHSSIETKQDSKECDSTNSKTKSSEPILDIKSKDASDGDTDECN